MNPRFSNITRRDFLGWSAAGIGAGLVLGIPGMLRDTPAAAPAVAPIDASDKIHVAIIGMGKQGQVLIEAMANIPGLHFQAVCDISDYQRKSGVYRLRTLQGTEPHAYVDIDDMLATEKGLDAVIIATPDFWHAPHTVKCLDAGLHVYCEKMMSHTIEGAREMVKAMEISGKLCQIGHQRRSNPRYRFTHDHLINGHKICGQIVNVNGQWNRSPAASQDIGGKRFPKSIIVPNEVLIRYGFKDMHQLLNWRHYRDLSGGPVCDLGGHQIDVFNWFLGITPKAVFASGGNDYFKNREHFDNLMAIFDYDTAQGGVRAFYQILMATNDRSGYFESFMGTEGTIRISELSAYTNIVPDDSAPSWDPLVKSGMLKEKGTRPQRKTAADGTTLAGPTDVPPPDCDLPVDMPQIYRSNGTKYAIPPHQPHLENFFAAIRGKATLNCDARTAFLSEAPVYWVNSSARRKEPIVFTPEQLAI